MTVTRHEVLTVTSLDDDPKSLIDALLELPPNVHLTEVEVPEVLRNWEGHRYGTTPVTMTFQREATDA